MYNTILIPILFDADRHVDKALEVARKLAAPDARFTLLHVMEMIPAFALSELSQDITDDARKALSARLASVAENLPGAETKLLQGHPGRMIIDTAEAMNSDLIVIASHRPGMIDHFLGSTASRVVRHAPCDVHVLR